MSEASRIRILYRSSDDELTERVISRIEVKSNETVMAFCHLRNQDRSFVLDRIEAAWDENTGEVIEDIWVHLGLPSSRPPPLSLPQFDERLVCLTDAEAKRRRNEDKSKLFGRFKLEVLIEYKRSELRALFSHRCFNCGLSGPLHMDHHIPQVLGGRLVPGNIVLLCLKCNERKSVQHPRDFYSQRDLERLNPLLEAQLRLFDFKFNWNLWARDAVDYLTSLGVALAAAQQAARKHEDGIGVVLRVSFEDLSD